MTPEAQAFDVLIALGTHPPMSDAAINSRLGISAAERVAATRRRSIFNHRWNDPRLSSSRSAPIDEDEVEAISGGLMRERVDVTINKLVLDYDVLLIVGPTFPHEVAGFSGGNKYLFPGISGQEIIDMFHWLGALITNPGIIGDQADTGSTRSSTRPRRWFRSSANASAWSSRDRSSPVSTPETPEEAWSSAADLRTNSRGLRKSAHTVRCCVRADDVRRALGGRQMRVQAGAGRGRRRRAHHLCPAHATRSRAYTATASGRSAIMFATTSWSNGAIRACSRAGSWRTRRTCKGIGTFEKASSGLEYA